MNYEKTFNISGMPLNKELPAQERKKELHRLYIRFSALIMLTNLMTYLLFSGEEVYPPMPIVSEPTIPSGYVAMKIHLKLLIPKQSGNSSQSVTLINNQNTIICPEAKIKFDQENNLFDQEKLQEIYQIYVPEKYVEPLVMNKDQQLWAIPFTRKLPQLKKRKSYEVIF